MGRIYSDECGPGRRQEAAGLAVLHGVAELYAAAGDVAHPAAHPHGRM
jgi:hypothetical protein